MKPTCLDQIFFSLIFIFLMPTLFAQTIKFEEKGQGWLMTEHNKPRYFYQTEITHKDGQYPRANYIHPLYGIDGEILTEDFPSDHLHHRGIFWAWHQLFAEGNRIADPWVSEGITWEVQKVIPEVAPGDKATLNAEVAWRETEGQKRVVLKELLTILFERINPEVYSLTFEISLIPLIPEVELGGSEDAKGYGGFSPRIKLSEEVGFYSEKGKVQPQELPIIAGPWMNITRKEENDPGIVIMGEPDQLPSYQGWILRAKNSMQNVAFPGKNPIKLPGSPPYLTFRNQLLIHQGLDRESIQQYYNEFLNNHP